MTPALLLAALIAGPGPLPADPVAHFVLAEMAPAPGRWEVEDAPAYFADRAGRTHAPATASPVAQRAPAPAAEPREDAPLIARHP
jgi:hypothetical protein